MPPPSQAIANAYIAPSRDHRGAGRQRPPSQVAGGCQILSFHIACSWECLCVCEFARRITAQTAPSCARCQQMPGRRPPDPPPWVAPAPVPRSSCARPIQWGTVNLRVDFQACRLPGGLSIASSLLSTANNAQAVLFTLVSAPNPPVEVEAGHQVEQRLQLLPRVAALPLSIPGGRR